MVVLIAPPHSLRQSPHHCSCPWVICISSLATPCPILYFTAPWLFCNYLFVRPNSLTSSPIPPQPPFIWQPSKCSLYPCLCSSWELLVIVVGLFCLSPINWVSVGASLQCPNVLYHLDPTLFSPWQFSPSSILYFFFFKDFIYFF